MLVRQAPYLSATATGFLLAAEQEECWSRLLYLVEQQRPLGLLTGAAEVGKTRMLQALAVEVSRTSSSRLISLDASGCSSREFIEQFVAASLESPTDSVAWNDVEDWLWGISASRLPAVCLIDHFDQAQEDLVPTVRRLTRLISQTSAPVVVVVSTRQWSSVEPLQDLADIWCDLSGWELESTRTYLDRFRPISELDVSFSTHAAQAVYDCTQGIAGRVRRLSELCRLAAQLQETRTVEVDLVLEVYGELVSPLAHDRRRN